MTEAVRLMPSEPKELGAKIEDSSSRPGGGDGAALFALQGKKGTRRLVKNREKKSDPSKNDSALSRERECARNFVGNLGIPRSALTCRAKRGEGEAIIPLERSFVPGEKTPVIYRSGRKGCISFRSGAKGTLTRSPLFLTFQQKEVKNIFNLESHCQKFGEGKERTSRLDPQRGGSATFRIVNADLPVEEEEECDQGSSL